MQEIIGNMWFIKANAYCVTTNNVIKDNGRAVMGAGVALSAARKFPQCDKYLADFIEKNGHIVGVFYTVVNDKNNFDLISFPTKYHWKNKSDIKLIEKSAKELMNLINLNRYNSVILPKPGCSNGGLDWSYVKGIVEPILDDRVVIVSLA